MKANNGNNFEATNQQEKGVWRFALNSMEKKTVKPQPENTFPVAGVSQDKRSENDNGDGSSDVSIPKRLQSQHTTSTEMSNEENDASINSKNKYQEKGIFRFNFNHKDKKTVELQTANTFPVTRVSQDQRSLNENTDSSTSGNIPIPKRLQSHNSESTNVSKEGNDLYVDHPNKKKLSIAARQRISSGSDERREDGVWRFTLDNIDKKIKKDDKSDLYSSLNSLETRAKSDARNENKSVGSDTSLSLRALPSQNNDSLKDFEGDKALCRDASSDDEKLKTDILLPAKEKNTKDSRITNTSPKTPTKSITTSSLTHTLCHTEQAHQFEIHTYTKPTYCGICKGLLVGAWAQGLQCKTCGMNVHRSEGINKHDDCRIQSLLYPCSGQCKEATFESTPVRSMERHDNESTGSHKSLTSTPAPPLKNDNLKDPERDYVLCTDASGDDENLKSDITLPSDENNTNDLSLTETTINRSSSARPGDGVWRFTLDKRDKKDEKDEKVELYLPLKFLKMRNNRDQHSNENRSTASIKALSLRQLPSQENDSLNSDPENTIFSCPSARSEDEQLKNDIYDIILPANEIISQKDLNQRNSTSPKTPTKSPTTTPVTPKQHCQSEQLAHQFDIHTYNKPTYCGICDGLLVGAWAQGLQCKTCGMNVHRGEGINEHDDCRLEALLSPCAGHCNEVKSTTPVRWIDTLTEVKDLAKTSPNLLRNVKEQMNKDIRAIAADAIVKEAVRDEKNKNFKRVKSTWIVPALTIVDQLEERGQYHALLALLRIHALVTVVVLVVASVVFTLHLIPHAGFLTESCLRGAIVHALTVVLALHAALLLLAFGLRRLAELFQRKKIIIENFFRDALKIKAEEDLGVSVTGLALRAQSWSDRLVMSAFLSWLCAAFVWHLAHVGSPWERNRVVPIISNDDYGDLGSTLSELNGLPDL